VKRIRFGSSIVIGALLASAIQVPVQAATRTYTVKATFVGASGKTVLLIAKSGRVLARKSVTSSSQVVSLTSPAVASIAGASLQMVTTSGGDYFGPVVLGWASKSKVYTAINSTSRSLNFGKVTLRAVTSKQGYAKANGNKKKYSDTRSWTSASNYRPVGVGTYGKAVGGSRHSAVSIAGRNAVAPTQFAVAGADTLAGADADGDGVPNAFDVNDDGDAIIDSADPTAFTPSVPSSCEAGATFNIFTNFKSTNTTFDGNINYYGSGDAQATTSNIPAKWTEMLSMVLQPVTSVCGESVTKTELMGVGEPYAPTDFVDIGVPGVTNDFQWTIGDGRISGNVIAGLPTNRSSGEHGWNFTSVSELSGQDTLLQRVTTTSGKQYVFAGTAGFVFVTHPLPVSYTINGGASTSFRDLSGNVSYGGSNHLTVTSSTLLAIEFYRPQRLAIDGESGSFYDLAGFEYTPDIPNAVGGGAGPGKCDRNGPGSALPHSQLQTDSVMTTDQPVDAVLAPTYTVSWRIGECYSGIGVANTWTYGDFTVDIQVTPQGPGGNAAQKLAFTAEPS
jgi:hypothetical protein